MSDQTITAPQPKRSILQSLEVDLHLLGMAQTAWLPQLFGLELGHPLIP